MNGLKLSDYFLAANRQIEIVQHFFTTSPEGWTAAAASGTVASDASRGGVLSLTTQAADNAVGSLTLATKIALVAANKPLSFAAYIQFAEAATNAGNVFVGLTSQAVATAMGDDGAGPPANYSGVGFYKVDGSLNWFTEYSVATTQNTLELSAAGSLDGVAKAAGSSSYQLLEIDVYPKTSTLCDVVFKIDDVVVQKYLDQVYTSIAAMAPVIIVKAGSTTAEVIKIDLVKFAQVI